MLPVIPRGPRTVLRMFEDGFTFAIGAHARMPTTAQELREYADRRTLPGGVRPDADRDKDLAEELADALNYVTWRSFEIQYMPGTDADEARMLYHDIGADLVRATAGTFHSVASRLLRPHAELLGFL